MTEQYTPDNPMYPEVQVTLPPVAMPFEIVAAISNAIRSKEGHSAANRFECAALEVPLGDLVKFARSTVTVNVS